MRQADKYHVPRLIFCNKMDKIGADFYRAAEMVKSRLDATPDPAMPIGAESDFVGVIDLIEMNALVWKSDAAGAPWDVEDPPICGSCGRIS